MKKLIILVVMILIVPFYANAEREELSDGTFFDEHGEIHDSKFDNTDIFAPWNDSLKRDDPFAPWNNSLQRNDPFAPWNNPNADQRDTNKYMRENGERNSDYYWK